MARVYSNRKVEFLWYAKKVSLACFVGYLAGIAVFLGQVITFAAALLMTNLMRVTAVGGGGGATSDVIIVYLFWGGGGKSV